MSKFKSIVLLSGGKDSVATSIWCLKNGWKPEFDFCDTGWEHPALYKYLKYLETSLGIKINDRDPVADKMTGQYTLVNEVKSGVGREKSIEDNLSIPYRLDKMEEIINESPDDHFIIWHNLENERKAIQKRIKESKAVSHLCTRY